MAHLSQALLAGIALAGWLSWTVLWWIAVAHGWKVTVFVWDRYHEQWVEGALFHLLTGLSAWWFYRAARNLK